MAIPNWQNNALMISFIVGIWVTATGLAFLFPIVFQGMFLTYGVSLMVTTGLIAFMLKYEG